MRKDIKIISLAATLVIFVLTNVILILFDIVIGSESQTPQLAYFMIIFIIAGIVAVFIWLFFRGRSSGSLKLK